MNLDQQRIASLITLSSQAGRNVVSPLHSYVWEKLRDEVLELVGGMYFVPEYLTTFNLKREMSNHIQYVYFDSDIIVYVTIDKYGNAEWSVGYIDWAHHSQDEQCECTLCMSKENL